MNNNETVSSLELLDRIFKGVNISRTYELNLDQLIKVADTRQENPYFWKECGHLDACQEKAVETLKKLGFIEKAVKIEIKVSFSGNTEISRLYDYTVEGGFFNWPKDREYFPEWWSEDIEILNDRLKEK